jgi:hypothetical protein
MVDSWRQSGPSLASEAFEDEVVIVDFSTGRYHSLRGSAIWIWSRLETGTTEAELLERRPYEVDADRFSQDLARLLSGLREQGLITASQRDAAPPLPAHTGPLLPYQPPTLDSYDDMEGLLWLDPIHEAGDAGWPAAAESRKA